jgi:large subunit ribosomal protein L5
MSVKPVTKTSKKNSDYGLEVSRGEHVSGVKPRLETHFTETVLPALKAKYPHRNIMEFPKIEKIIVSTCQGKATQNSKILDSAVTELEIITGMKPVISKAKKSIAAFKLRKGLEIGASVTLRRQRMYEFLDRLISVGLPRIRDFKGVSLTSFDGKGNYSLGLKESTIFPEIAADKVDVVKGLSITIVTSAVNNADAMEMLALVGIPFKKTEKTN